MLEVPSDPNNFTQILSVNLPAGSYAIQAKLKFSHFFANGSDATGVCDLDQDGQVRDVAQLAYPGGGAGGPVALQTVLSDFAGGAVTVDCQGAEAGGSIAYSNATLTAIKVGAVN